jgi:hypothetical protein
MSQWLRGANQSCPSCKVPVTVDSLLKNRTAAQFIGQCKVRCLTAIPEVSAPPAAKKRKTAKKADICNWVDTTETLDKHMQECRFVHIPCPHDDCGWTGPRSTIEEHAAVCEYREELCGFCCYLMQACEMEDHFESCDRRPVVCHNVGCYKQHAFEDTAGHRALCRREEIGCPYSATLGCGFTCARECMPAHAGDASAHFAGLMTSLQASQVTIGKLREDLEEQTEITQELQAENKGIKQELERLDSDSNWSRAFVKFRVLLPTTGSFKDYQGPTAEQTIGGCRWGVEVLVSEGQVWAIVELMDGLQCPFEITCHLFSKGGTSTIPIISKTLTSAMGEVGRDKWRKGVELTSSSVLDERLRAGHTLRLYCFLKIKISSK